MDSLVVPLQTVGLDHVAQVGGKNAALGEMLSQLTAAGVRVPDGFATTAAAYRQILEQPAPTGGGSLREQLATLL